MKTLSTFLFLLLPAFTLPLFSAPVLLTPEGSQPQLAVSPSGHAHIVYGTRKDAAIFHAASADGGKTFTDPIKIGNLPDIALGMGRGPQIAATSDSVLITAISHKDGMIHLWQRENGAGGVWKEQSAINDTPGSAKEGLHSMAANGAGKVAVVWLDGRSGKTEIWISTSDNSGKKWAGNTMVYRSPDGTVCECCRPTVAVGEDGRIAVMWRNWLEGSRDMYVSEIAADGVGFTKAKKLGSGTWKLKGCPMDGGSIAFGKDGKIETAWRREKSSFTSKLESTEILVSENAVRPLIFPAANGSRVFYESKGNVLMSDSDSKDPKVIAKDATFPSAALIPGKGIILAWESNQASKPGIFFDLLEAP